MEQVRIQSLARSSPQKVRGFRGCLSFLPQPPSLACPEPYSDYSDPVAGQREQVSADVGCLHLQVILMMDPRRKTGLRSSFKTHNAPIRARTAHIQGSFYNYVYPMHNTHLAIFFSADENKRVLKIGTQTLNCCPFFCCVSLPGRPCVDCHAFEFMQRALQDLKKTAFNLDTRVKPTFHSENVELKTPKDTCVGRLVMSLCCLLQTETLVLRAERRALCDCMPTNSLR